MHWGGVDKLKIQALKAVADAEDETRRRTTLISPGNILRHLIENALICWKILEWIGRSKAPGNWWMLTLRNGIDLETQQG